MQYATMEQLSALKLNAMKAEYMRQIELPAMSDLSFDDRFSMIVNEQYEAKQSARIKRLIGSANLRDPTACLENLDYDIGRNLKKNTVAQLSDCNWIREGHNMIITGATGTGKTYLGSAFGRAGCLKGFNVKAYRMTRLLTDLEIGRGDGSYNKLLRDLTKPDLLILDDFGLKAIGVEMTQDLNEVIEERYIRKKSVLITAQLPVKDWPPLFLNRGAGDALMDRLVRNAYRFNLTGPSRRPTVKQEPDEVDFIETRGAPVETGA